MIRKSLEAPRSLQNTADDISADNGNSEARAFAELYRKYRGPIHRYLAARTPDAATAEDLTAHVFVNALRSMGSFRGESSHRTWLHQIARNTLANWRAEKARLQIPVPEFPDASLAEDSLTAITLANEERELLGSVLSELPEAQREVVHLRYWDDLSTEEIAQATGRTPGAIRVLLHRARQSLRSRLNVKELTAILGATGAAASIAWYSVHRRRQRP